MANKTVLVIDTDTETIQKVMSGLESEGHLVFTASEKDVSIKMAKKIKPSLILINISMSGASGLEICKAIHGTETLKDIPIVMITPHEGDLDSRHKTVYGVVDTIKKPFETEDLISKATLVMTGASLGAEALEEELEVEPLEEDITAEAVEDMDVTIVDQERKEDPLAEEVEVLPLDEDITAQPVEDDFEAQAFGDEQEEELQAESFEEEEEADTQFLEEEIEITPPEDEGIEPVEEEIDIEPFQEEEIEIVPPEEEDEPEVPGKEIDQFAEPEIIEEEVTEIEEKVPQGVSEEEAELTQMLEEDDLGDRKPVERGKPSVPEEPVAPEQPDISDEPVVVEEPMVTEEPEEVAEPSPTYRRRDSLYRGSRRRSSGRGGRKLVVPLIIIVVLLLGGGGALLYYLYKPQAPVVVKRERPAQKQPAQVQPAEDQKMTAKQVEQKRRPPKPSATPAPATAVKPKAKPKPPAPPVTTAPVTAAKTQAKTVYSVQLGAYKNKANADALVMKFKQKGYDAFVHQTATQKGTLYKVLIGKFDNRSKATFLMREIRNSENVSAIIFHGKV
jgi:CheY-like chemotaxis protein